MTEQALPKFETIAQAANSLWKRVSELNQEFTPKSDEAATQLLHDINSDWGVPVHTPVCELNAGMLRAQLTQAVMQITTNWKFLMIAEKFETVDKNLLTLALMIQQKGTNENPDPTAE